MVVTVNVLPQNADGHGALGPGGSNTSCHAAALYLMDVVGEEKWRFVRLHSASWSTVKVLINGSESGCYLGDLDTASQNFGRGSNGLSEVLIETWTGRESEFGKVVQ